MSMHIFITGGTGLIGKALVNCLLSSKHSITILTRNEAKARLLFGNTINYIVSLDKLESLDDYDVIINLAGEPIVGKLWSSGQKKILCESRWNITRRLAQLIEKSENPPSVFISGSAVGYYGSQGNKMLTEVDSPHNEFTYKLCAEWERLAQEVSPITRVCLLRTGIVLSTRGGMLKKMTFPFKYGLGCSIGNGKQYISWIHIEDMVSGIVHLINTPTATGAFNLTSPNPETNKQFSNLLAQSLHRPCIFRIPACLVRLVMGEASTMLIDGQRVLPRKLTQIGYKFKFTELKKALDNLHGN